MNEQEAMEEIKARLGSFETALKVINAYAELSAAEHNETLADAAPHQDEESYYRREALRCRARAKMASDLVREAIAKRNAATEAPRKPTERFLRHASRRHG